MKTVIISISLLIIFFGCDRQWDNPLSTDDDLKNTPKIVQITLDSDNNASIVLDYAYSDWGILQNSQRFSVGIIF